MLTCKYSRDKLCNSGSRSPPWPQGYDWGSKHPLSTAAPDPNLEDPSRIRVCLAHQAVGAAPSKENSWRRQDALPPFPFFPPLAG